MKLEWPRTNNLRQVCGDSTEHTLHTNSQGLSALLPSSFLQLRMSFAQFPNNTHVLGAAQSHAGDARNALEVQLLNGLAGLLLVTAVDLDGGARGVASLDFGVGAVILLDLRLDVLVGKLFDSRVGHVVCYCSCRVASKMLAIVRSLIGLGRSEAVWGS